ncbi:hypothetical protein KP509_16G024900 [Ceratopteris richardii]|uniref:Uncharacterized protein n=1 Tax=Ceratopteris richardii TaxID=49495 RepID=A0A8T2T306_CERRI|nr:hypothetical protein KP509_16G024900 [Ceratopteris richardii]
MYPVRRPPQYAHEQQPQANIPPIPMAQGDQKQVNVLELTEEQETMDTMRIKRTRVQDRDRSQDEDSNMGTQTKKGRAVEGEASKRKRRPRRKITMEDFPLGKGIKPYDLSEDISTQKPNITWPQLLQLSSKTKREWSKLGKGYPIILGHPWLIAVKADKKWDSGLLVLKPNDRTKSVTYDLKDQKKEDHMYEKTIDEESSCYDNDSSSEESTIENDS